jgi:4-deoxy-L-threo-5-hexosulose-uronate ketol-isomerase
MRIDARFAPHPDDVRGYDTARLRGAFLVDDLFRPGEIDLTYSHLDRIVLGGVVPLADPVALPAVKATGTRRFLDRRELGIVNIGAAGAVSVGGERHRLGHPDVLYVGMGAGEVSFASLEPSDPARFYLVSTPAHRALPTRLVTLGAARRLDLGAAETSNRRSIFQFIRPEVCDTCQLVLGITELAPGSIWNTMPAHVHDRRSEAYLYFALPEAARVFHFMGEPGETRHLVVGNEEAVLSPGWSIHCGAGTSAYAFVWAMGGDNVDYADVDPVAMEDLR